MHLGKRLRNKACYCFSFALQKRCKQDITGAECPVDCNEIIYSIKYIYIEREITQSTEAYYTKINILVFPEDDRKCVCMSHVSVFMSAAFTLDSSNQTLPCVS